MTSPSKKNDLWTLQRKDFPRLIETLREKGYLVVGPRVRDEAIIYDELTSADDLPAGYTDEQEGGFYRLKQRQDNALFGYAVGPHSWKKYLFPPETRLWQAKRNGNGFDIQADDQKSPKYAFIGVRACELNAIAIQDKVFLQGKYVDPHYQSRRENAFIVAVNCGQAAKTCFCDSMNAGPEVSNGYDLALTEVVEKDQHYFVVEVGSERGSEIFAEIPRSKAKDENTSAAKKIVANTRKQMGRKMDTEGIRELLQTNYDHPRWDEIAKKCLACANCTMVCPTCFCSTVEDVTDLDGDNAERWRKWDSCFTGDFTYIHGGTVRTSIGSRYRQWMTHKLSTWHDQFDSSGCVGCGRCITWCPIAIDITEEVDAIRKTQNKSGKK